MVATTTTSTDGQFEAYSGTLQEVLNALDGVPHNYVYNVFHDGTNHVAVVRKEF